MFAQLATLYLYMCMCAGFNVCFHFIINSQMRMCACTTTSLLFMSLLHYGGVRNISLLLLLLFYYNFFLIFMLLFLFVCMRLKDTQLHLFHSSCDLCLHIDVLITNGFARFISFFLYFFFLLLRLPFSTYFAFYCFLRLLVVASGVL